MKEMNILYEDQLMVVTLAEDRSITIRRKLAGLHNIEANIATAADGLRVFSPLGNEMIVAASNQINVRRARE